MAGRHFSSCPVGFLLLREHFDEVADRPKPFSLVLAVGGVEFRREHKLDSRRVHLFRPGLRYRGLERDEVLPLHAIARVLQRGSQRVAERPISRETP